MLDSFYIFRSPNEIEGFFDFLFGGIFIAKGFPLLSQLVVLTSFSFAVIGCLISSLRPMKKFVIFSQIFSILCFSFLAVLLLQPWDEVFVNLRHSWHIKEYNIFSFNKFQRLEGTVEFLPYLLIGYFGKLGFYLPDLAFVFSFLGGIFSIFASVKILEKLGFNAAKTWGFLFFSTYPPLIFNSSHGFMSSIFTAAILWAIHFFLGNSKTIIGLILFSILPLIRFEGLLLTFLFIPLIFFQNKKSNFRLLYILFFLPAVFLVIFRYFYFGSIIPLPIKYKSSIGNLFYFLIGMRNLVADLLSCCGFTAIVVILMFIIIVKNKFNSSSYSKVFNYNTIFILVFLSIFSLCYYVSGGDWFPSYWGRYLLPFSVFVIILALVSLQIIYSLSKIYFNVLLGIVIGLFLLYALWPISSYSKMLGKLFTQRKALAMLHYRDEGRGHYRIHYLSQLGVHLKNTTAPNYIIGSSEVATIMYFAERDALDLLGIVNPEIVKEPLRKAPKLIRQYPLLGELPYLIFRRINPTLVEKHKPQIVYTFDFILRDLLKEIPIQQIPIEEITDDLIYKAVKRWNYQLKGLMEPLYGGVENLIKIGYTPFVVLYKNGFCSLYFVYSPFINEHIKLLKNQNFTGGWKKFI